MKIATDPLGIIDISGSGLAGRTAPFIAAFAGICPDALTRCGEAILAGKPVLLVVGAPHSGTTILDAALGVSPHVVGMGEAVRLTAGINTDHLAGKGAERIYSCGQPAHSCPVWSGVLPHLHPKITVRRQFPMVDDAARALSPEVRYVLDSSPNAVDFADEISGYDLRVIQVTRDVRSRVVSRRKRKGTT